MTGPITIFNYPKRVSEIELDKLPLAVSDTHKEMPLYLEYYNLLPEVKQVVDKYLSIVNTFVDDQGNQKSNIGAKSVTKENNLAESISDTSLAKQSKFSFVWLFAGIAAGAFFLSDNKK